MVDLSEIVHYTDTYLNVAAFRDYCPVGLQVEGKREVAKIVTGVSACMPLFERAVAENADAVLVHHGMFWENESRVVRGSLKKRLRFLLDNDLSLIGYHLPLDAHPEVGNNIGIVTALKLIDPQPFGKYQSTTIGYLARTVAPVAKEEALATIRDTVNPHARGYLFGPDTLSRIAICSGGAPELLREAIAVGADLYLTGEESEWIYHLAREENIHYVAAGHHCTERLGVQALGDHLAARFGIAVQFVDIDNPI